MSQLTRFDWVATCEALNLFLLKKLFCPQSKQRPVTTISEVAATKDKGLTCEKS